MDYTFKNSMLDYHIDQIIAKIDPAMYSKIKKVISFDIKKLIFPNPRRNRIPRAQNKFLIYRRAFQQKYSLKYGHVYYQNLGFISKLASNQWKCEDDETKNIYEYLSNLAKQVHKILYPNYNYKPRKKQTSPLLIETINIINGLSKQFAPVTREMNHLPTINQLLSDSSKIQHINNHSRNEFHLPPIRILPPINQLSSIRREMNSMPSISQLKSQQDTNMLAPNNFYLPPINHLPSISRQLPPISKDNYYLGS